MYGPPGPSGATAPEPRRPWWAPAPDPELPPIRPGRAYAEVLLVFAAFFLAGIVAASLLLADRYRNSLNTASWAAYGNQAVDLIAQIGLALAVVLLLSARRGVSGSALGLRIPRLDDGRLAVSRSIRIVAWGLFALIVGGVLNAVLQTGHLPTGSPTAPELLFGVVDSVQAGVIEELVVLAFVVVTLRQARRPWWEVTAVALVLRGSYHIYYGPGVFGILLWAALYYWTYLRFRELVPLMVCHAGWDIVGFLSQRWAAVSGVALLVVVAIWMSAIILWLSERNSRPLAGAGPAWPVDRSHPVGEWRRPVGGGGGGEVRPGPARPAGGPWAWPPAGRWQDPPAPGVQPPASEPAPPAASGGAAPPGWHPDPAGYNRWRWWDGQRWTEHVSHHG